MTHRPMFPKAVIPCAPLEKSTSVGGADGVMRPALMLLLLLLPIVGQSAEMQVVHGHVPAVTTSLAPVGRLPADQRLNLAIGLPLRNREGLTNLLENLYDPHSPMFRQYLTAEQFAEQFGPSTNDYEALITFAQESGFTVTTTHPNRVLLDVNASVADIERALHLTMHVYQHPTEARNFYAPDAEPSLDLAVPLMDITGLDNYTLPHPVSLRPMPSNRPAGATPQSGSGPGGYYLGNDFRAAYAPGVTLNGAGQQIGLLQFDGYYTSDITWYERSEE